MSPMNLVVENLIAKNGHFTQDIADLGEFLEILQFLIREPSVVGSEDAFFGCCAANWRKWVQR